MQIESDWFKYGRDHVARGDVDGIDRAHHDEHVPALKQRREFRSHRRYRTAAHAYWYSSGMNEARGARALAGEYAMRYIPKQRTSAALRRRFHKNLIVAAARGSHEATAVVTRGRLRR